MNRALETDLRGLLHTPQPPRLGPGPRAHIESAAVLNEKFDVLRREHGIGEWPAIRLRALVLFWHDQLHAAHGLVQELGDGEGSWIHGMVHRREPDYWNAKYWFRRVGQPALFRTLGSRVLRVLAGQATRGWAERLTPGGVWDALVFVDWCQSLEKEEGEDAEVMLARRIQQEEFDVLFEHLVRGGEVE